MFCCVVLMWSYCPRQIYLLKKVPTNLQRIITIIIRLWFYLAISYLFWNNSARLFRIDISKHMLSLAHAWKMSDANDSADDKNRSYTLLLYFFVGAVSQYKLKPFLCVGFSVFVAARCGMLLKAARLFSACLVVLLFSTHIIRIVNLRVSRI